MGAAPRAPTLSRASRMSSFMLSTWRSPSSRSSVAGQLSGSNAVECDTVRWRRCWCCLPDIDELVDIKGQLPGEPPLAASSGVDACLKSCARDRRGQVVRRRPFRCSAGGCILLGGCCNKACVTFLFPYLWPPRDLSHAAPRTGKCSILKTLLTIAPCARPY
jgi:hypothetical protein